MKIKENRTASFVIISAIYAFATVVGILTYTLLPFHFAISLLIADIVATVITFIFSLICKNASVYDPYWSVQPIVIVITYAIFSELSPISICAIVVICFWGIRLTANWAYTFKSLMHQDWRYTMLCEKTKAFYPIINFVGIHLVPTLVVYGCILPAVYLIKFSTSSAPFYAFIPLVLSLLAVILQGISDIQMHKFRKNRTTTFIRVGLWKYSRHPNYLGEILMWWGIGLCTLLSLGNWLLILGAVSNTLLFLFVSIPMADKRNSKKENWEEYKKHTFALLPIYHK